MSIDFNQTAATIQALLQQESQPIMSRADIGACTLRRKEINTLLSKMETERMQLVNQFRRLPRLPEAEHMDWAEAVLAMPNLAIVVLDTTGVREDSDVIRVCAIDRDGNELINQVVRPMRQNDPNTTYTGLAAKDLEDSPTLSEIWWFVCDALRGRYVVSFNLDFVETRLKNNIEHYGLQRLPFIGDCLMFKAKSYFGTGGYNGLKLSEAVMRIGKPFPCSPPLAQDRAVACLSLLLAMSQGITSVPSAPKIDANTDLTKLEDGGELAEIDDHPF